MTSTWEFAVLIIFIDLVFDFATGRHDSANSIATVVSTRVLTPLQAVAWAAFFNFVAFAIFGTAVAKTIAGDLVDIKKIAPEWQLWVLLSGLIGAIVWDVITWYLGLPTSSSHALIGAYAGAAVTSDHAFTGILKSSRFPNTTTFIILPPVTRRLHVDVCM